MIGIFDSGVGGLTVLQEVEKRLPGQKILYFADSGHSPYGQLSQAEILTYAYDACRFLEEAGATVILLACHTLSTTGGARLQEKFSIPLLSIATASLPLLQPFSSIALLGTKATVASGYYQAHLESRLKLALSCPQLVPLIESSQIELARVEAALEPLLASQESYDALFLACTHYPLLSSLIAQLTPLPLINPAAALVNHLASYLPGAPNASDTPGAPGAPGANPPSSSKVDFFTTGSALSFQSLAQTILKRPLSEIHSLSLASL